MSSSSEEEFEDSGQIERDQDVLTDGEKSAYEVTSSNAPVVAETKKVVDDSSSSDSDVPLSQLKTSSKRKSNDEKAPPRASSKKKKPSSSKKEKESNSSSRGGEGEYATVSAALFECKKGLMIQRLLCRWWYAMEWPNQSDILETPPPHYDSLDGFPGVYVCTSGDNVGHVMDRRDHSKSPNFNNFAALEANELQTLLLKALKGQLEELVRAEGKGTPTEHELNDLIKWATKLSPTAVEKEARKVLKKAKINSIS